MSASDSASMNAICFSATIIDWFNLDCVPLVNAFKLTFSLSKSAFARFFERSADFCCAIIDFSIAILLSLNDFVASDSISSCFSLSAFSFAIATPHPIVSFSSFFCHFGIFLSRLKSVFNRIDKTVTSL